MRTAWKEVGVFDRDSQTFHVERIPAPPESRTMLESDPYGYQTSVGVELKVACPKCLEPIVYEWRHAYTDRVLEDPRCPELAAVVFARDIQSRITRAESERDAFQGREHKARELAESWEASFRRIQLVRSARRKRKERQKRSRDRAVRR